MQRRDMLRTLAGLGPGLALAGGLWTRPAGAITASGAAAPFDEAWLREQARMIAAAPFQPVSDAVPESVNWSYDQYLAIHYRRDEALWHGTGLPFQAQFFHRGFLFRAPVAVSEVFEGMARPLHYSPALYDFGPVAPPGDLPDGFGFAGVRLHHPLNRTGVWDELAVFLGASYFRALGRGHRYGISARGVSIDTVADAPEEFPAFRAFWLERPARGASEVVVHALLDGPSLAGAFRIAVQPGADTVMTVSAALFPRRRIEKLGLAPLTSMYLFGTHQPRTIDDFRPEVHDSDGLLLRTGGDEWIWRPLVNPDRRRQSLFTDTSPRGFGLMQRQRDFAEYQDLQAHYERRPSLWVEPLGEWGAGAVELVELPTPFEYHDNIVAAWIPAEPLDPGSERRLDYRLHWCSEVPVAAPVGRVVATRVGRGGVSGTGDSPVRKFVVDFQGGRLDALPSGAEVEAAVTAQRGTVLARVAQANDTAGGWRAFFDVRPDDGADSVELRCTLRLGDAPLTETWAYQWTP